jgi:hypothetical protein
VLNDDVPWAQAHLAAWDEVFKNFGAKPKRTPARPPHCESGCLKTVRYLHSTRWWTSIMRSVFATPFR